MPRNIRVTQENDSGRNTRFENPSTGEDMSRAEFVRQIRAGQHDDYHVRIVNRLATPASNPNRSDSDNLG